VADASEAVRQPEPPNLPGSAGWTACAYLGQGRAHFEDAADPTTTSTRTDPTGQTVKDKLSLQAGDLRHGHALAVGGYRAREANGVLRVRCDVCASAGTANPYWTLSSTGPIANHAELDDQPYRTQVL
jgi:hypothetical protein